MDISVIKTDISNWYIYIICGHLKPKSTAAPSANAPIEPSFTAHGKKFGIYIGITKDINKRKTTHLLGTTKSSKILLELFDKEKMYFTELGVVNERRIIAELLETYITLLFKYNFKDYSVYGGYYNSRYSIINDENIYTYFCTLFNIDKFYFSYIKKESRVIEENKHKLIFYLTEFCHRDFKITMETGIINDIKIKLIEIKDFDNDTIMI
jgi:hypothetical protein